MIQGSSNKVLTANKLKQQQTRDTQQVLRIGSEESEQNNNEMATAGTAYHYQFAHH